MNWRPNSGVEIAKARQRMMQRLRDYFLAQDVTEVCTPALTTTAVTDPAVSSLRVADHDNHGFLHTSPEFAMKRLLAAGYPDIYQICRVFRGGESGQEHLAEFTMVEWYRHSFELTNIIDDTIRVIDNLLASRTLDPPKLLTYSEAFDNVVGIDPLVAGVKELANILKADNNLQNSIGADRDAWLDLLMTTCVSPCFGTDQLTIVFHYPASQASLARLCPVDNRLADRFEVFFWCRRTCQWFCRANRCKRTAQTFST